MESFEVGLRLRYFNLFIKAIVFMELMEVFKVSLAAADLPLKLLELGELAVRDISDWVAQLVAEGVIRSEGLGDIVNLVGQEANELLIVVVCIVGGDKDPGRVADCTVVTKASEESDPLDIAAEPIE